MQRACMGLVVGNQGERRASPYLPAVRNAILLLEQTLVVRDAVLAEHEAASSSLALHFIFFLHPTAVPDECSNKLAPRIVSCHRSPRPQASCRDSSSSVHSQLNCDGDVPGHCVIVQLTVRDAWNGRLCGGDCRREVWFDVLCL
jgi:hypothetical protein